jgi:hypothetical protein
LLYVILLVSCSATITRDTVKTFFEVLTQQSDGGAISILRDIDGTKWDKDAAEW